MYNKEDRVMSYTIFIGQAQNEPLWKRLRLEEKLYLIKTFRKVFEKCPTGDLQEFKNNPLLLFSQVNERGVNRFRKLNAYVDSLNTPDLSSEKKRPQLSIFTN
jgi:hypothetical protein